MGGTNLCVPSGKSRVGHPRRLALVNGLTLMSASTGKSVALALIVRNEAIGIREVLPKVDRSAFDQLLAVDGNSTDDTVAVLADMGVPTVCQEGRGLGAAMIDARRAVAAGTDAIVFYHPDGNEDPADLPRMAELLRGGADFVVASRMVKGAVNEDDGRTLKWRKWANQGLATLANVCFAHGGNRTSDVTNGFRGISLDAWDRMRLTSTDLTMDYQMVIRALKLGVPITEFPTAEGERCAGATNFASLPTGIAELKLVWRELRLGRRRVTADESALPMGVGHATA
jgi:glycosyltransferase involved in cell wall biosynthesis